MLLYGARVELPALGVREGCVVGSESVDMLLNCSRDCFL